MLRQYQLHGGIRRLQTRFDQSKRFGTTTTMAASAAPTPWNRPPPSVDDFRWWDEIFLKLTRPLTSKDALTVHQTKHLGEPHNGQVHTLLVPTLEKLFSRLDEPRLIKSPGSETLKTTSFSCPQTTHFHHFRRIRRSRLKTNPIRFKNPIPPLKGDYRLPKHRAKPFEQQRLSRRGRGHLTSNAVPGTHRGGQGLVLGTSDPRDI